MTFETNANKHGVQAFESIIGFNEAGEVVYSVTGTLGTLGTIHMHEEAARKLGAIKMAAILNGERSSWYEWDGECFVCNC